jgi:hypothetical protein
MIGYRPLSDVAEDVRTVVAATNAFRHTASLAIDSYTQLREYIKTIPTSPAAVICIANGDWTGHALKREFTVAIVVFAPFKAQFDDKSNSVWTLAEAAAAPFLPVIADGQAPVFKAINGVDYELDDWRPLSLDEKAASFVLELTATEVARLVQVQE